MARSDWRPVFRGLPAQLRDVLPPELHAFQWAASGGMAKAWYGNRALHYEIWVRASARSVEIGLHFESDSLTNARLLAAFRARSREIKRSLGGTARIEEWDKGWNRVWEPFSLSASGVEETVASRFCDYVRVLEPILRDELPADVDWVLAMPRSRKPARARGARTAISSRTSR